MKSHNLSNQNVLSTLISREYYHKDNLRKNLRVLKLLICKGNYRFKKVWEKHSHQQIFCESSSIFLENYTKCFSGYGLDLQPVHRFTLPRQPGTHKIVDAILSYPRPTDIATGETHVPQMMAVTSNNKLLIVDLVSGRCLKEVLVLGSRYTRLKSINWAEHEEKVVLSTTHCQRQMDEPDSRAAVMDTLKILAVFNIMPLEFECMFEVKKRVFGSDTVDAIMSQGHLITMHQSRLVRMYDLQDLLPQAKPVKLFDSAYSPGTFHGQAPTPLPINLVISELPRCLFEVACSEHSVQIGGFPWHYLISPPGSAGTFDVYSVDTGSLAKNGHLDSNNDCLEMDRASFHGDESGRIIHVGAENVSVFYLKHDSILNCNALMQAFVIRLQDQKPSLVESKCEPECRLVFYLNGSFKSSLRRVPLNFVQCPTTASGRKIKRRFTADEIFGSDMCLTIHEVDYEDELDVMMVCSTIHQSDSLCGKVGFYDNATGHHLTSLILDEPWSDYMEHSINMDLDTIVHLVKSTQGKFACQVYRLAEAIADDDLYKSDGPKKGSGKGKRQNRKEPQTSASCNRRRQFLLPRR